MKSALLLSSIIPSALGATIYLAGDSTMAKGGTGSGTAGTLTLLHLCSPKMNISNVEIHQDGVNTSPLTFPPPYPTRLSQAAVPVLTLERDASTPS